MEQNGQIAIIIFVLVLIIGGIGFAAYHNVLGLAKVVFAARKARQPAEGTESA